MKHCNLYLLFGFLAACPDPSATSSGIEETETQEATITNNGPSKMESDPNAARIDCATSECVDVVGSFNYTGSITGSLRIDVQKHREGAAPSLVHTDELQSIGEFSVKVPVNYGKILITGFIDKDGNGPTTDDPQGRLSVEVGAEAISGLQLEVKDDNPPPAADPTGQVPDKPPPGDGSPAPEGSPQPSEGGEQVNPAPAGGSEGGTPPNPEQAPAPGPNDGPPSDDQ
jgi:hypothetical protein